MDILIQMFFVFFYVSFADVPLSGPIGSKAMNYSNGLFDCQSPSSPLLGSLRAVHLLEELRGLLELMDTDERENLRSQVPENTAEGLVEWLQTRLVSRREGAQDVTICYWNHE